MKTITIRLPDVEAAMLVEVQVGEMPRPLRAEHQVESVSLSSRNVPLTTPAASGLFVSHHLEVQQPSVFDCQGLEA